MFALNIAVGGGGASQLVLTAHVWVFIDDAGCGGNTFVL